MIITLNEAKVEIPQDWTIRDLVQDKGLLNRPIAVEVNFELVPQDRFSTWSIKGGDSIEIVTLSGGG